jgi:hypothetical protein
MFAHEIGEILGAGVLDAQPIDRGFDRASHRGRGGEALFGIAHDRTPKSITFTAPLVATRMLCGETSR